MDPQVSTSFIPKKPLTGGERVRGSALGFIVLIAILIFIASGVAAGGVFFYGKILEGSLVSKKQSLEKAQNAYDPGVIEDLLRLEARINQSRVLLGKHVAPTSIFQFLSEQTLENVTFNDFSYILNEQGVASIALSGHAKDFSTVALQSDRFGGSKMLRDVVFSGISIVEKGGVNFEVKANIDSTDFLYSKSLSFSASNVTTITQPVSTSTPAIQTNGATSPGGRSDSFPGELETPTSP